MRRLFVLPLLGALVAAEPIPNPDIVYAEQLLKGAGISTDGPALKAALSDKEAVRRAAAASVYSQGNEEQRRTVAPLLRDADASVRYHAASGLVRSGDRIAVPTLMTLLTDSPLSIAWQTEDL